MNMSDGWMMEEKQTAEREREFTISNLKKKEEEK
jgi:hypothetical protein